MGIQFATDEWIKALMAEVNQSAAYAKAAQTWEGDFYFIVDKGGSIPEAVYMYMDLWHGQCREAYKVDDPSQKSPAFLMNAPVAIWQQVFEKKIDPIRGMMSGKLKLKGNMMKVIKTPKAAIELVECCTKIDTVY
jgi:putative sterol carrier protein